MSEARGKKKKKKKKKTQPIESGRYFVYAAPAASLDDGLLSIGIVKMDRSKHFLVSHNEILFDGYVFFLSARFI